MADNLNGDEIQIGNRRLRKIKRPKPNYKPLAISDEQVGNVFKEQAAASEASQDFRNQEYYPYVEDDDYAYQNAQEGAFYQGQSAQTKKIVAVAVVCLCVGLLFGKFLFSGAQVVQNGLQGVVVNPEVPKGRSRCGVTEKTQGCVLYVMNPQRQELNGRDFYDLAAQLTGRQRFVIETGNMRYSNVKIKPGAIAQLNIPPLQ